MTTNTNADTDDAHDQIPDGVDMTDPYADDPAFVLHQGGKLGDRLARADRRPRGSVARLHPRRRAGVAGDRRRARTRVVAHRPLERRRRAVQRHRRARSRRHRPRGGDGRHGGQGGAVQAVRWRRRLPGVRERPHRRRDGGDRHGDRSDVRRASTSRTSRRPSASRSSGVSRRRSTSPCSTTTSTAPRSSRWPR